MNVTSSHREPVVTLHAEATDVEGVEYETRGGIRRVVTRISVRRSANLLSDDRPYDTFTWYGYQVRKDGSRGAEFHDDYASLRQAEAAAEYHVALKEALSAEHLRVRTLIRTALNTTEETR